MHRNTCWMRQPLNDLEAARAGFEAATAEGAEGTGAATVSVLLGPDESEGDGEGDAAGRLSLIAAATSARV